LQVGASSQIELMKFDMAGCAAVLGCALAIGEIKPKVFKSTSIGIKVLN
jgi:leucyl aminopeptidase